jgi:cysteinyl-tRNA synthetase
LTYLRSILVRDGAYAAADEIRSALAAGGIELRDSSDGTVLARPLAAGPGRG